MILTFDNQDDVNTTGPHNVSIYTDDTLAESLFKGDLVNGPATVEYQVPGVGSRVSTTSSATCIRR